MDKTNFCRSFRKSINKLITAYDSLPQDDIAQVAKKTLSTALEIEKTSVKFLLPFNGLFCEDKTFHALQNLDEINLPFDCIALEYHRKLTISQAENQIQSSKSIIFAKNMGDYILMQPVSFLDSFEFWRACPPIYFPKKHTLDMSMNKVGFRFFANEDTKFLGLNDGDYDDEVYVLFSFLNILCCSNVEIERVNVSKKNKSKLEALPFDDYRILTLRNSVAGSDNKQTNNSRSPREHLRRGHIRRLNEKTIWVNSCVVNGGTLGKITKSYLLNN